MLTSRSAQRIVFVSVSILAAVNGTAAQYVISTFAGAPVPDGAPATSVSLSPRAITRDASGNVYFADYTRVYKLNSSGTLSTVAGSGASLVSGDGGPATAAGLSSPNGLAIDSAGNLYIGHANRVRKVDAVTGVITSIAGATAAGSTGDGGPATAALLNLVSGIALDSSENLFICDSNNNRVRKIAAGTGIITTVAGTGATGSATSANGDGGLATSAQLQAPSSLAFDNAGNWYISDRNHNKIRKVSASGIISTVVGSGQIGFGGDGGLATSATLSSPFGIALDQSGNLYLVDSNNGRVRKVVLASGIISTIAGNTVAGYSGDNGLATAASLTYPVAVDVDNAGTIYIADQFTGTLRKISSAGIITTIAGGGAGGNGGPASKAQLIYPNQVAIDSGSHLAYLPEDARVRVVDLSTGIISTFAGTGVAGFGGDNGPALKAGLGLFAAPVVPDGAHNLYIADYSSQRIRKVAAGTGIITTVVGSGASGFAGDGGLATAAKVTSPSDVKLDSSGNLYFADSGNHRVRRVAADTGIITTVAGSDTPNNAGGFSGDGGQATLAQLHTPFGIAFDKAGNLYIADSGNHRIRKVDMSGVITTFAGSDTLNNAGGFGGDGGSAISAQLNKPVSLSFDSSGNLFVAEQAGARIREITTDGKIDTIAGTGTLGFAGDGGPATSAELNQPEGVTVDAVGQIYIADTLNMRVRLLTPAQITAAGIVNSASNLSGPIAPGEILTIYGSDFGPATGAPSHLDSTGKVDTVAGSTRVLFDGQPGPIAYALANQVNVIAPYSLAGMSSTKVQVEYLGQTTNTVTLPVAPAAPGIFSYDSSGKGQAVLVNQDATLNTPVNPAPRGSYVYFYATGEGQTNPSGVDGKLASDPYPAPVLGASINLGGTPVVPLYAGSAPGFVAGVMQVNFQVPDNALTGTVPLTLLIGGTPSQAGITISIR